MVLDIDKINQINKIVYERPLSINEIAMHLNVNWRTADRYVDEIAAKTGEIQTYTFRKGTRGALKIVYWKNVELANTSKSKHIIYDTIMKGVSKADFSPFDIYQYARPDKRLAFSENKESSHSSCFNFSQDVTNLLLRAQTEFLSFSGDMSWVVKVENGVRLIDVLKKLAENNVKVHILSRVDFKNIQAVEEILSINESLGKRAIDMRHVYQPLRGGMIDEKILRLKEAVSQKSSAERNIISEDKVVFYEITDPEWIELVKKVFWDFYHKGIPAETRLENLRSIHRI